MIEFIPMAYFKAEHINRMERSILSFLQYENLMAPTVVSFATYYSFVAGLPAKGVYLVHYLCDLTVIPICFIEFLPSLTAAAALCLTRIVIREEPWSEELEAITGYKRCQVSRVVIQLHDALKDAPNSIYQSVYREYMKSRRMSIATLKLPDSLPLLE